MSAKLKLEDGTWSELMETNAGSHYNKNYMDTNYIRKDNLPVINVDAGQQVLMVNGWYLGTPSVSFYSSRWLSPTTFGFSLIIDVGAINASVGGDIVYLAKLVGATFRPAALYHTNYSPGYKHVRICTAYIVPESSGNCIYLTAPAGVNPGSNSRFILGGVLTLAS